MGKNKKEHRKKVAKRNEDIKVLQNKHQKVQNKFLMDLIEREKAAGKFNNTPKITTEDNQIVGIPSPILTTQQGPII